MAASGDLKAQLAGQIEMCFTKKLALLFWRVIIFNMYGDNVVISNLDSARSSGEREL